MCLFFLIKLLFIALLYNSWKHQIRITHFYNTLTPTAQQKSQVWLMLFWVTNHVTVVSQIEAINEGALVANPAPSSPHPPPGLASPPLGKGRHLSRSQSLRSVDSRKRDDVDKTRSGQQSTQTGKTTGRRGIPCISHCGSLGDHFLQHIQHDNHKLESCTHF